MTALFALVGVDYVQWRAVSRTLLRTDFRVPLAQSGEMYSLATVRGMLMLAVVHGFIGLASAFIVVLNRDAVLTGTIVLSYLTFVLATSLLTQHGVTLLSATDYLILGPRPVSSRTFLAIRLTNVLFHALLLTTFIAVPPIVAFGVVHGASLARALAAACAIYTWAVALTLVLSAGYGTLLRLVGAARLQRALGYMQLVVGLLMYGGVFLTTRLFGRGRVESATMPEEPWPWVIPPAWYAGYLDIAMGEASLATWARAALSIGVVAAVLGAFRGRLGLDYAAHLAEVRTASADGSPPRHDPGWRRGARQAWLFRTGEARAAALLTVAHFRHDLRVRMGVLGVLPLLVFYLFLGGEQSGADPFVAPPAASTDFVALAVLLFPAILAQQFSSSDDYRAAWIYHVTPADHARLVVGSKNVAVAHFLMPFLLVVVLVYSWRFRHVGHAFAHTAVLGLISHLALQGSMALAPHLPFSRPPEKMRGSASLFAWMLFVILGGQLLIWALPRLVYVSWSRVAAVFAALGALTWLLDHAIVRRVGLTPS